MRQHIEAVYIHIPFCRSKCSYCDFISSAGCSGQVIDDYVQALCREIDLAGNWAQGESGPGINSLTSIFVGGGTPTIIPAAHMERIMSRLRRNFPLSDGGEFTIEANPGTVDQISLAQYRSAGFNRISFGLQAMQPHLLKLLGRGHDASDFIKSVAMAREAGFASINADIMFGLPGQTVADIGQTLDLIFDLPIQHLSFYSLSLEEGTPLYRLCRTHPDMMPDDDEDRRQYHYIRQRLPENGFEHYEISNAAQNGHQCRHNLVYWQALPYYGFGLAAHSYLQRKRRANTENMEQYIAAFNSGLEEPAYPVAPILESTDRQSMMQEMMILGMRLINGVKFEDFQNRFNCDLRCEYAAELVRLEQRKLIYIGSRSVRLTGKGLDMANQVFSEFI